MSSPDVFKSSPPRRPPFNALHVTTSSPDLPPLQDILSRNPPRWPIRSGSKAQPIPIGANTTFTSAKEHWKLAKEAAENDPDEASIIEIEAEVVKRVTKTRRKAHHSEEKVSIAPDVTIGPPTPEDRPWKKYLPSPKSKTASETEAACQEVTEHEFRKETNAGPGKKVRKKTGVMSAHFKKPKTQAALENAHEKAEAPMEASKVTAEKRPEKLPANFDDEPLLLEQAAHRRADWTPPPGEKAMRVDSAEKKASNTAGSPTTGQDTVDFKSLLQNYGCNEKPSEAPIPISDEDSSFLKKRKLGDTTEPARLISPGPEKSPTKQKAPKKKARTITDLATAAYRPIAEVTEEAPTPVILGQSTADNKGTPETNAQGKSKAQTRKKAPKKSKKKIEPPKPVLLSPGTALREVSKQDFLFGTSSQLVQEQSPTLLRDIQTAMRNSNEVESINYLISLNSDPVEPHEQRRKLWGAAARDTDGQLFDAEIVDLMEHSPKPALSDGEDDPFGYICPEDQVIPQGQKQDASEQAPNSDVDIETLSDIFPSPAKRLPSSTAHTSALQRSSVRPTKPANDPDCSFETLDDILPSSPKAPRKATKDHSPSVHKQAPIASASQSQQKGIAEAKQQTTSTAISKQIEPSILKDASPAADPKRPKYELYTDAQLSVEITKYGFKPLKRRTAMITLLDQCWQSRTNITSTAIRNFSTSSAPPRVPQVSSTSPTRPRGRPRKNSPEIVESQEPPPSGQATESPRRSKGRPKKTNSTTGSNPSVEEEAPPSGQPLVSPKRGRGRPRKDSGTSLGTPSPKKVTKAKGKPVKVLPKKVASRGPTTPVRASKSSRTIIEIPDSASEAESNLSRSPTTSPEPTFSPPPGVDFSTSMEEDTELSFLVTPDDQETVLHGPISEAVTSAPSSTDPAKPSWYEKILLYDPIILEDLTAWLNAGQLSRVGYDGEISPGEVKKWCESNSICCLWRVNLRGKERKRF